MSSRRRRLPGPCLLLAMVAIGACGSSGDEPSDAGAGDAGAGDVGAGDAGAEDAGASCEGFLMPNPATSGLPNPASYAANADGTVTDQVTGLVWQGAVEAMRYTEDEARARCTALGAGWRLPTRLELVSLVDFTIAGGATIDPAFAAAPAAVFWTSSPYYGDASGDFWYVGFDAGYSDYGSVDDPNFVRCVHPPTPKCFAPRYERAAGGDVVDRATGLTWQLNVDAGSYTWDGALAYCAGLGAGWRVPSLKETQTIIDDAKEFPAVDPDVFPGTPIVDFWTSTAKAGTSGAAWYVDFFYGASDSDVPSRLFRVRCVR